MPLPPGQPFTNFEPTHCIPLHNKDNPLHHQRYQRHPLKTMAKILDSSSSSFTLFFLQTINELATIYFTRQLSNSYAVASVFLVLAMSHIFITKIVVSCLSTLQVQIMSLLKSYQYNKITISYQKTLIVLLLWTAFASGVVFAFGLILRAFSFPIGFSLSFLLFVAILVPYYFSNLLFNLMRCLHQSCRTYTLPTTAALLRIVLNIIFNVILSVLFGPDILLIGLSLSLSEIMIASLLYIQTKHDGRFFYAFAHNLTAASFENSFQFLKFLLAKGSVIYFQRIPLDVLTLVSLFFCKPEIISAFGFLSTYSSFLLSLPFAICLGTSKHLKIAVKEGGEDKTKNYALNGCLLCVIVCFVLSIISFTTIKLAPVVFSQDINFHFTLMPMLNLYTFVFWGEITFAILSVILRNLFERRLVLKYLMFFFYFIEIPLSIILGNITQWEEVGLLLGLLTGILLLDVIFIKKLILLDWWQEVRRAFFSIKSKRFNEVLLEL